MNALSFTPGFEQTTRVYCGTEHTARLDEINNLLREGWQVVSVTPAAKPGYGHHYPDIFFYVVLERRVPPK
jgi:hypothetical protein